MLQRLTGARGVSGNEGEVRAIVRELATPYASSVVVDSLGSVIVTKPGTDPNAPTIMLCAHMDEVGLMITDAMENGLLRYSCVGYIDPVVLPSKRVKIGKNAVQGVIGAKAVHLQEREEATKPYRHKDLLIDIGAKDRADALKLVSVGDYVSFDSEYVTFGEGLVKSRALDDRVGCYAILQILQKSYPCTVVGVFAVQEEVGTIGARAAAQRLQPSIALIIEGTTAGDTGDAPSHEEVCCVGKGPVISFMDRSSIANYPLMNALRSVASANNIPWQIKRFVSGGNDSGVIQRAGAGTKTTVISVPCRYIHSPAGVCSLDDVQNTVALIDAFLASGATI